MRIVFMGTPDFAVPSLQAIIQAGHTVPLVVTTPDRVQGRGLKMIPSAVKSAALELGLSVTTPESLKDEGFQQQLRDVAPDLICVVAFRILPESVYTIPRLGSFNLHGSLLPHYRGAAPINRALMAGEGTTGVTTFFLKKIVDTGDIILRKRIPVTPDMTAGELHDTMMLVGADAVSETLRMIESGTFHPETQNNAVATKAPKIFRDDCRIPWNMPADMIHDCIRGLSPYPGAFSEWRGKTLKIYRTAITGHGTLAPGELLASGDDLFVGTGTRDLAILQVQQQGKRSMGAEEFVRGARLETGERLI